MNQSFQLLWLCISFSKLAVSLFTMTLTITIYHISNSATMAALVSFIYFFSKVCSSFLLPYVLEKYQLKKILTFGLVNQIALVILLFFLFTLHIDSSLELILIFIILSIFGMAEGFTAPTRLSLIPNVVKKHELSKANSLISITDQTFLLLGWSFGVILITKFGAPTVFCIIISLLLLSSVFSFCIKLFELEVVAQDFKWKRMFEGWNSLFSRRNNMRTITIMDILEGIGGGIWIGGISLVFVKEILGQNESWWGYVNAGYFIGSIIGGIIISLLASKIQQNLVRGIVTGSLFVSLLILLYALNHQPYLALLLVVLMGPFYQLRDISQNTFMQINYEDKMLSKIYSAKDTLYYLVFSFSVFMMGMIADYIGVQYVYICAFILYFLSTLICIYSFWKYKSGTSEKRKVIDNI